MLQAAHALLRFYASVLLPVIVVSIWMFALYAALSYAVPTVLCSNAVRSNAVRFLPRPYTDEQSPRALQAGLSTVRTMPGHHPGFCKLHLQSWRGLQPGYRYQSLLAAVLGNAAILDQWFQRADGLCNVPQLLQND